jgi:hypothetical protein
VEFVGNSFLISKDPFNLSLPWTLFGWHAPEGPNGHAGKPALRMKARSTGEQAPGFQTTRNSTSFADLDQTCLYREWRFTPSHTIARNHHLRQRSRQHKSLSCSCLFAEGELSSLTSGGICLSGFATTQNSYRLNAYPRKRHSKIPPATSPTPPR